MSRHGQVEITTPEPYRWGDGSDGSHIYGPTEYSVRINHAPSAEIALEMAEDWPQLYVSTSGTTTYVETTISNNYNASTPGANITALLINGATYRAGGPTNADSTEIGSAGWFVGKKVWVPTYQDTGLPLPLDYFFVWNESTALSDGVSSQGKKWGGWELVKKFTNSDNTIFFRRVFSRESKVPYGVTPFTRMYISNHSTYPYAERVAASTTTGYTFKPLWYADPYFYVGGDGYNAQFTNNFMEWIYFEGEINSSTALSENAGIGKFYRTYQSSSPKNFTNVVIRDNTELSTGTDGKPIIIFATESITFGAGVRINSTNKGTNTGRNSTGNIDAPPNNPQVFTGGAGGGGGGANGSAQAGQGGQSKSWGVTKNGTHYFHTYETGGGGGGGYGGRNALGGNGGSGSSSSTLARTFMKALGYTMKGKYNLMPPVAGISTATDYDDFAVLFGGRGGYGGYQYSSYNNGGKGARGGGSIILVAPEIIFPEAPYLSNSIVGAASRSGAGGGEGGAYYQSDATLLYARGQTATSGSNNGTTHAGQGVSSCYEEGIGGSVSGYSMDGTRRGDGGGGSGGGGGGGSVVVVYNKLRGHPTIRTYGGESGYTQGGGNRGGGGGVGGHGYYLIGYKGKQNGPIQWVKEGAYGMKRGIHISSLQITGDRRSRNPSPGEVYSSSQWPYLNSDGLYQSTSNDGDGTGDVAGGGSSGGDTGSSNNQGQAGDYSS